ncbi:MAG: ABC transporter permease [Dehalococcoidales bacterium]|nr:ABC transporter permease [Dehalococcoidales bacterium]
MFLRMVKRSFTRGWKKKALAVITVAIGTALVVAMLNVSLDIGDKVGRELRSYGANIMVTPEVEAIPLEVAGVSFNPLAGQSYLADKDIPKLKMIFWRNNIVDFAPYLKTNAEAEGGRVTVIGTWFDQHLVIPTGETIVTGVKKLKSWWQVEGAWPDDEATDSSALVGKDIARRFSLKPGDDLGLVFPGKGNHNHTLKVSGIISGGGAEDSQVFVPLSWLQEVTGQVGKVSQVEVSALTMPKNALALKAEAYGPDSLSSEEFETWYCSPYVDSVAYQIEEAIPGARARAIRQIAETEGTILGKVQLLMAFLALAAVTGSALGISSLMSAFALERSREIGLLKALGAYNLSITWLFMSEAIIIGIVGGGLGYAGGVALARFIAESVFDAGLEMKILVVPIAFMVSVGLALLGSLSAARVVTKLRPSQILVGR